jgi:hypothetical protein
MVRDKKAFRVEKSDMILLGLKQRVSGLIVVGAMVVTAGLAGISGEAWGQQFVNSRAVGGVVVDPSGMLAKAGAADLEEIRRLQADLGARIPAGMESKVPLRKISLVRITQALGEAIASGQPVPEEIYLLGGLQEVRYIVADREAKDIVLVGPAEGWKPGPSGVPIGVTSGRAVMLLDDLVVALRSLGRAKPEVITCSINPRPETLPEIERFTRALAPNTPPDLVAERVEQILGPQEVSVTGVPVDSHFARVLVAADFRMKRFGLGLDPAPVPNLPPFTAFIRGQAAGMMPRWWLVPEAPPVQHDPEGLIWQLPEIKVKTLSETQFLAVREQGRAATRSVPGAERWAEAMTAQYDRLAAADPVFDQLRNCMELALVAAVITSQRLADRVGADLGLLLDEDRLPRAQLVPASKVPSRSVVVRTGRGALIACGGVEINPWRIIAQSQQNPELRTIGSEMKLPASANWWAN